MRGIHADARAQELAVVAAERALPVSCLQNYAAPRWVTTALGLDMGRLIERDLDTEHGMRIESNCLQHVGCHRVREVARDKHARGVHDQRWADTQGLLER